VEAIDVVSDIEGISLIYFDERDVVRHNLVQRIIKAYEEHTAGHPGGSSSARSARAAGAIPPGENRSRE
jgi:phosphate starvation-inducible PhoH-like protein